MTRGSLSLIASVLGLFAAIGSAGCHRFAYQKPLTTRDVRRAEVASRVKLKDGRTTAVQTRRTFGPPDYWSDDGSLEVYYTEAFSHFHGTPGFQPDTDRRYDRYYLLLKFGRDGVLERHRMHRMRPAAVAPEVLDRIARSWGVTGSLRGMEPDTRPVARDDNAETPRAASWH